MGKSVEFWDLILYKHARKCLINPSPTKLIEETNLTNVIQTIIYSFCGDNDI